MLKYLSSYHFKYLYIYQHNYRPNFQSKDLPNYFLIISLMISLIISQEKYLLYVIRRGQLSNSLSWWCKPVRWGIISRIISLNNCLISCIIICLFVNLIISLNICLNICHNISLMICLTIYLVINIIKSIIICLEIERESLLCDRTLQLSMTYCTVISHIYQFELS